MKAGDLVRHKATGELAIVRRRGKGDLAIWMTLVPFKSQLIDKEIIYLAEYFELISEAKENDIAKE
tara:strand:- start:829 stop:1026 length:198 start_codon:yes stop_codon:yes gene_type:complete